MKVNYLEKQVSLTGSLTQDSLSVVAEQLKGLLTSDQVHKRISYWQLIFLQSKVNGCSYRGEDLPQMKWRWPRDTWFQEQLSHHLKALEFAAHQAKN